MKKWLSGFISLILAVTLLVGGLPFSALAAEARSAQTGAETYTDGDYTYTVLSGGAAEIVKYNGTEAQVTIPSTLGGKVVTSIGNNAFDRNANIASLTVPENIGRMGNYAFANCANLRSVTISAETVGWQAFTNCDSLTDISLTEKVKTIERGAFADCGALESITIPDSVTQIDSYMASGCPSLTSFSIGSGVKYIPEYAFSGCTSLAPVTIPDYITEIRSSAFAGCTALTSIEIPSNVTTLGSYAFSGCSNLSTVTLNEGLEDIGWNTFESAPITEIDFPSTVTKGTSPFNRCSELKTINLPDGITAIPLSLYQGSGVERVEIPEGVTLLKNSLFRDCSQLVEVKLPSTLTTIEQDAFVSCTSLHELDIPASVRKIGSWAFGDTTALTKCTFHEGIEELGISIFRRSALTSIYVPATLKETQWPFAESNISEFILGEGVTELPRQLFKGCALITDFTIPSTVTKIGDYAFSECTSLEHIVIPESVTEIGNGAFESTTSLTAITLPDHLEKIGSHVFRNNSAVTSLSFPKTLTYANAPLDGSNITSVTIENGITALPDNILNGAGKVTKVKIPASVTAIGDDCFRKSGIRSVTIPDTVTTVGKRAFYDCFDLYAVRIGSGISTLPSYCFGNCSVLQNVEIPDSVTEMADGVFFHTSLTFLRLPQTIRTIGMHAFENSKDLIEVVCSDELISVGDSAFLNCTSFTTLRSAAEDVDFSNSSFDNCPKFFDKRFDVYNRQKTAIESTGNIGIDETLLHFTVRYDIRDDWADENIEMGKLYLELPDNLDIIPASFSANGFDFDAAAYTGDYRTFELKNGKSSGALRFSAYLKGGNDSLKNMSASVEFRYNRKYFKKPLGDVKLTASKLSVFAPSVVTDDRAIVSGYSAFSGKSVNIHITHLNSDGTKGETVCHTVTPNKYTGKYISEPLSILSAGDETVNGDRFEVYAECNGTKSETVTFSYISNAVTVQEAYEVVNITRFRAPGKTNISHDDQANTFDITNMFTRGASPVVILNPKEMLQFKFRLNNAENVSDVILMSNRDGLWQFMELFYDKESDMWIGEGNFDIDAHELVPGQYNLPGELHLFYYYGERKDTYRSHYYGTKSAPVSTGTSIKELASVSATEPDEDEEEDEDEPFYYDKDGKPHGKLGDYNETIRDAAFDVFIDIVRADVPGALSDATVGGLKALWEWGNKDNNLFRTLNHGYYLDENGNVVFPDDHVGMVDPGSKQRNCIDPSGYVYEAVEGNRVEGATATIYKLNRETGEWVEWNAADFEQENPLKTNNEGAYAWFTDEGAFKVTISKDGYEPVTSEEFKIPPEKLDLNFSMVDKTTHPVAIAEKDPETGMYTLKFSKFMQVDTVTAETIGAEGLTDITITPALLSEGDAYADTFTVAGTQAGDAVRFNIKETALSYSGVSAEASTVIPRAILLGDVDGDEEITIIDALLIRRRIADIPTFAYHEDVADTDGDGAITIMDATFIQGWLADLPSNDAIGKPIKHD